MFAYIGGYTTPDRDGRGNGINVFDVQPNGDWIHVQAVGHLENPSLFTLNRAQTVLYSVHGGRPLMSAFRIDAQTGNLALLNQVDPKGSNPVDSALDSTEKFLVVANYASGSVAVLPVGGHGELHPPTQVFVLEGQPGPHPKEQTSSHPHAVIFDPSGNFVIVPDKGLDKTFIFQFRNGKLTPTAQAFVTARPGAAPRHTAFHPTLPILYVNNELDSTVAVYDWTVADGHAAERQVLSTLPPGFSGQNTTAEILPSPDGRVLYVSNRGQDSIAFFDVDPHTGTLTYAGSTPSGGARPRFFTLGPGARQAFVANQDSDVISVFDVKPDRGRFIDTGARIQVGSPSAISFVGRDQSDAAARPAVARPG